MLTFFYFNKYLMPFEIPFLQTKKITSDKTKAIGTAKIAVTTEIKAYVVIANKTEKRAMLTKNVNSETRFSKSVFPLNCVSE